jgi:hypothetical protein
MHPDDSLAPLNTHVAADASSADHAFAKMCPWGDCPDSPPGRRMHGAHADMPAAQGSCAPAVQGLQVFSPSALHAHHLLEGVHHIHQVSLRGHHRVDVLAGRWLPNCLALALTAPLRVTNTSSPKWCSRLRPLWWPVTASVWPWKFLQITALAASIPWSGRAVGYFSAATFSCARPFSKSLPIMVSMLTNTPISLVTKGAGPNITQRTSVPPSFGARMNSAVL